MESNLFNSLCKLCYIIFSNVIFVRILQNIRSFDVNEILHVLGDWHQRLENRINEIEKLFLASVGAEVIIAVSDSGLVQVNVVLNEPEDDQNETPKY